MGTAESAISILDRHSGGVMHSLAGKNTPLNSNINKLSSMFHRSNMWLIFYCLHRPCGRHQQPGVRGAPAPHLVGGGRQGGHLGRAEGGAAGEPGGGGAGCRHVSILFRMRRTRGAMPGVGVILGKRLVSPRFKKRCGWGALEWKTPRTVHYLYGDGGKGPQRLEMDHLIF